MNGPTPCSYFEEPTPLGNSVQQYRSSICMHNLDHKYSAVFLAVIPCTGTIVSCNTCTTRYLTEPGQTGTCSGLIPKR